MNFARPPRYHLRNNRKHTLLLHETHSCKETPVCIDIADNPGLFNGGSLSKEFED